MTEYFTAADGARLAYTDRGEGLPILCLAGLTRHGRDFDYMQPHLDGVRLICPDYRGRGKSQWTGVDTYTVPQEAADAVALLDHLGLDQVAVLGTSRGGLIGMVLGATAAPRLMGLAFNDVGPVIERAGLERIFDYVGRNPAAKTHAALAEKLPAAMPGFYNVPASRWLEEAVMHYRATDAGLTIDYDPVLRDSFLAAFDAPPPDLWPLFEASAALPTALIRGANSDLLSEATAAEMRRRRPTMTFASVPDRAHIPFLDEPEAIKALTQWIKAMQ